MSNIPHTEESGKKWTTKLMTLFNIRHFKVFSGSYVSLNEVVFLGYRMWHIFTFFILIFPNSKLYPFYWTGPAQHSECTMNITCARLRVCDWLIDWLAAGVSTASAHCLDWWAEPCQVGERLHCSVTGQLELQDHQWLIHFSAFMLAVLDCNRHWLQLSE